jgi:hypothetical protein
MSAMTGPAASLPQDGRGDFDFLMGRWKLTHHRLRERLVGDTHWEDFAGTCEASHIIGGLGNVDDNLLELPAGTYRAATLRLFNPEAGLWSIWWIDARSAALGTPVHGRFEHGVGTFLGDDTLAGRPIRIRFVWSQITPRSARWEQAFSTDGGESWEMNWRMDFERVG